MLSLSKIESDLQTAIKAKDQLAVDTLRGLKSRIQNEQIAKISAKEDSSSGRKDLSEAEIVTLVKSEVKRRKEAAESFKAGGRLELAEKEEREAAILEVYLPPQMSEAEIADLVEKTIQHEGAEARDFGKIMGKLKAQVGQQADWATLARILKEKLK